MARIDTNDYIGWIHQLAMRGKSFFSKDDFVGAFPGSSVGSLAVALSRLVDGGWIVSPWQNFYVIVPIQYKLKGEVPPSYYIDELMMFLRENLAFRGGTALHKLFLQPQPRYIM